MELITESRAYLSAQLSFRSCWVGIRSRFLRRCKSHLAPFFKARLERVRSDLRPLKSRLQKTYSWVRGHGEQAMAIGRERERERECACVRVSIAICARSTFSYHKPVLKTFKVGHKSLFNLIKEERVRVDLKRLMNRLPAPPPPPPHHVSLSAYIFAVSCLLLLKINS